MASGTPHVVYIVYLASIAAFALALRASPGRALVAVYLPVLLLVPNGFRAITPGIPDPNFNQAAILPILLIAVLRFGHRWRPSVTDLLVLAMALIVGTSEYLAAGYDEAQNLIFDMLASVVAPYAVARLCIGAEDLHVALAKRFVILVFAVAIVGLFEFRFGMNPFIATIGSFFPGQATGWVTTFRYGVARVAGPYSHAILAGIVMALAYRLARWLQWGGHWQRRFAHLPWLPWSKAQVIAATLLIGSAMTIARGPWLGALIGAAPAMVGRARNRRRLLGIAAALLLAGVPLGWVGMNAYLEVAPGAEMTMSQESALYRKVLIEKYVDIAIEHAALGWGRITWPKVPGMSSIDNYFLLLALMHGVVALALLVALFLWQGARLMARGMVEPRGANSLAFTFVGMLLVVLVSVVTVYLGEQVLPILFLIFGWSEAWLQQARAPAPGSVARRVAPVADGPARRLPAYGAAPHRRFRVIR